MPSSSPRKRTATRSLNPLLSHPFFCDHSPFFAAIDIVILLLALFALGVLTLPYFKFILQQSLHLLPQALDLLGEVVYRAPVAYAAGMLLASVSAFAAWEITDHIGRKCGKPCCKGMRKAVEFDIQIESEECVRCSTGVPLPKEGFGVRPLGLGQEHKELEAELKKMAPPNGRTVLIFRAPCGCPAGRLEVWGNKKVRRIKK